MNNDLSTKTPDPAIETAIGGSNDGTVVQFPQQNANVETSKVSATAESRVDVSKYEKPDFFSTALSSVTDARTLLDSSASLEDKFLALNRLEKSSNGLEEFGRFQGYKTQGHLKALITTFYGGRQKEWIEAGRIRGIDLSEKRKDYYPRLCKIIFGHWESPPQGNTPGVWKHNRSAEKFAPAQRYLAKKNVPVEKVAEYLANFKFGGTSGITAIELAERAERLPSTAAISDTHPKNAGNTALQMKTVLQSRNAQGFTSVKRPADIHDQPGGIVYLAARLDGDELRLLGQVNISDAMVVKDLKRLAESTPVASPADSEK